MKYETLPGGKTRVTPENEDEEVAVAYVSKHVPIFAGSEASIIAGVLYGIRHERERWEQMPGGDD